MKRPQVSRELDRAGIPPVPFRVLAHAARCADRRGSAELTLESIVTTCGLDTDATKDALRSLEAAELLRVRWDGDSAHVTLTGAASGPYDLTIPAWVDDGGLSPAAFRVLLHHVRRERCGIVVTRATTAARLCRLTLEELEAAEAALLKRRGWLQWRGPHWSCMVYGVSPCIDLPPLPAAVG